MKIKIVNTIEINTKGQAESGRNTSTKEMFMKGDIHEVTILREKKGTAEIRFRDGFVGHMNEKDFEKDS